MPRYNDTPNTRNRGLKLISRVNRWLAGAAIAATGAVAVYATDTYHHASTATAATRATTAATTPATTVTTTTSSLTAPATTPTATTSGASSSSSGGATSGGS